MYLAQVLGTVVASQKVDGLTGQKMLLVQPVGRDRQATDTIHVAIDTVRAGEGDFVTCVGSREAAVALDPSFVPVDAAIVGIVDALDLIDRPGNALSSANELSSNELLAKKTAAKKTAAKKTAAKKTAAKKKAATKKPTAKKKT